jgi:hypothetical protein
MFLLPDSAKNKTHTEQFAPSQYGALFSHVHYFSWMENTRVVWLRKERTAAPSREVGTVVLSSVGETVLALASQFLDLADVLPRGFYAQVSQHRRGICLGMLHYPAEGEENSGVEALEKFNIKFSILRFFYLKMRPYHCCNLRVHCGTQLFNRDGCRVCILPNCF